jgi:hypothetical protein
MDEEIQVLADTSMHTRGSYIIGVQAEATTDGIEHKVDKAKWYLRIGFMIEPQINSTKYIAQICLNPTIATAYHSIAGALDALEGAKPDIKPLAGFKITGYVIECWETVEIMTIEC